MPNRENGIVTNIFTDTTDTYEGFIAVIDADHKPTGKFVGFTVANDYRPKVGEKVTTERVTPVTNVMARHVEPLGLWRPDIERKRFVANLNPKTAASR